MDSNPMGMIGALFWLLVIGSMFLPMIQHRMLEAARMRLINDLEQQRGSRVIVLIHRQESMSLLGFPLFRYISIEDSEQVLRAIRMTPDSMPIDIILHTPGGLVLASEQIACALQRHPATVSVFVPHYAMSGGTLVALAADRVIMDPNAVLGPVDPQLGQTPAASVLKVLEQKPIADIDDQTLILADVAEKAMRQVHRVVSHILADKLPEEQADEMARALTDGRWTHDYPIMPHELQEMGLSVATEMPSQVYSLMALYPQPAQRRPSVEFIPAPYHPEPSSPSRRPAAPPA